MEDFAAARGYGVVEHLLTYLDRLVDVGDNTDSLQSEQVDNNHHHQQPIVEDRDARLAVAMNVIEQVGEFVWVGSRPLELPEDDLLVYSPYNEDSLPPPASAAGDKGKEGCIRNMEPLKILQNFVLEVRACAIVCVCVCVCRVVCRVSL